MSDESKFGDFEEVKEESKPGQESQTGEHQQVTRVRMPREGQVIGKVILRLGGNRMDVKSTDGKVRNCRVPGRYKRRMWLRPGDIIMIEPWPTDDGKADIVFKYHGGSINQLRKKGILDSLKDEF